MSSTTTSSSSSTVSVDPAKSITYFCREGTSDKVYTITIDPTPLVDHFSVNVHYGKRGAKLNSAPKSKSPLSMESAEKMFDALCRERIGKGYTVDESGASTQTAEERQTGRIPQLPNPIEESELERLFTDDAWLMQEKMDGVHIMVRVVGEGEIEPSNRKGLVVSRAVDATYFYDDNPNSVYDGEFVGLTYWIFDYLQDGGVDWRQIPYEKRFERLSQMPYSNSVKLVATAIGEEAKRALYTELRARNAEGVVFKRRDSLHRPGRPNSGGDMLKFKFWASATCRVKNVHPTKRSVLVEVAGDDGHVAVGNVTIHANQDIPVEGTHVEVRYLYWYPNGSLIQPNFLGVRDDKDCADHISSLKAKSSASEDEES